MNRIHLSIDTRDLEASVAFYRTLLGAEPDKRRPGYARFAPARVPIVLTLNHADRDGLNHLGVRVEDAGEVTAALQRIQAAALPHRTEEGTNCCHAVQDKVWVTDPAGQSWEVYRVTDDAPDEQPAPSGCCAVSA